MRNNKNFQIFVTNSFKSFTIEKVYTFLTFDGKLICYS